MRAIVVVAFCAVGLGLPEVAAAQWLRDGRVAARRASSDTTVPQKEPASRRRVFWVRSLTATAGSVAGAYGGYVLGRMYTPRARSDLEVLSDQEAVGLAAGFLVGAAIGAAIHSYDSKCDMTNRFLRGLGGAAIGIIPAVILGPFGPGFGAAAAQGRC